MKNILKENESKVNNGEGKGIRSGKGPLASFFLPSFLSLIFGRFFSRPSCVEKSSFMIP